MKTIVSVLLVCLLTACGGGGGSTTPAAQTHNSATLYDTSYKNFSLNGIDSIKYPTYHLRWGGDPIAIGFGDFIKQGELSVFVAYQNYIPTDPYSLVQNNPQSYASEYVFYTVNDDKSLTKSISLKGCLHPRTAVVADFNKDNIPDVFVSCTGYDNSPFPGERSQLVLSTTRGQYIVKDVGEINFNHGASAADVNNDGYPDVVVAVGNDVHFYINQKDGTFIKDRTRVNVASLPYYNVEMFDVDGDGKIDLLIGGHEFEGAVTKILYNDGNGNFGVRAMDIPASTTYGLVNSFTLNDNILYINRTTDRTNSNGWYNGLVVQALNLSDRNSKMVANNSGTNTPWVGWLLPKMRDGKNGVGSYNKADFYMY